MNIRVALAIYHHHKGSPTTYILSKEAEAYFDGILDNLASQFNSHYNIEDSITELQTQFDEHRCLHQSRELIGCLSAVLKIYNNDKTKNYKMIVVCCTRERSS